MWTEQQTMLVERSGRQARSTPPDTQFLVAESEKGRKAEVRLIPFSMQERVVVPRSHLGINHSVTNISPQFRKHARDIIPAIALHLEGHPNGQPQRFTQGRTLISSPSVDDFAYTEYVRLDTPRPAHVLVFKNPAGVVAKTTWEEAPCGLGFRVWTELENHSAEAIESQLLTSFCLGGISPFVSGMGQGSLYVHRFRSFWSSEGRHVVQSMEDLHLEPSWNGSTLLSERFGQVGTMPTCGYFPTLAIEDASVGVMWGARLAWPGSWQMEILRRLDNVSIAGGLADYEFGHWRKTLLPGKVFCTPEAYLTCVQGDIDALCARLTNIQEDYAVPPPSSEQDLPVAFNDWCTHWGSQSEEAALEIARKLRDKGIRYYVIDAGWSQRSHPDHHCQQSNGDWDICASAFPRGLAPVCSEIRKLGMVPGLWFEFEVATIGSKAFAISDHKLRRHGRILRVGERHFWDMRDPWVFSYLTEKVIRLLKENGFGYLKVDYNDGLGLGCDSEDGLGEGLRQHVQGVLRFFRMIQEEIPDIVIENCASGGHRLEPMLSGICPISSFSDAHESVDIPIIAAHVQRHIPASRSMVWAVLRERDDRRRLLYSLCATFLGRMCLSGAVDKLSSDQWQLVEKAINLYQRSIPVIKFNESRYFSSMGKSWREPTGWQALLRFDANEDTALAVIHAFDRPDELPCHVYLPSQANWEIVDLLGDQEIQLQKNRLTLNLQEPFSGVVALLQARS